MLANDRLIQALARQPVDRTPVWMMRQAGRYLPEYRELRKKAGDFLSLCKTPELACQITLQPIERFPLDAAIIFSDILTIPDAYGLGLHFIEGEGPRFKKTIRQAEDIHALPTIDPETELRYVMDAIRYTQQALANKIPLIGFSGSPWTLATYMVEGGASKQFTQIKRLMYQDPTLLHQLLAHLSISVIDYLQAQIKAGVNAVMIFDTWGGILPRSQYLEFSLYYMTQIVNTLNSLMNSTALPKIPIILFTKNGGLHLEEMAASGCDALGIDWMANLSQARLAVGNKVALQGNLDPSALYGSPQTLQAAVKQVLDEFGAGPGHIFNLGHGIHPDIDPEQVALMIQTVHDYRPLSPL
jgi:uroporphyrinogen decarboxylase